MNWLRYAPLLILFWCDALALELLDAVATTGFVDQTGLEQIPWLWAGEMVLVVALAAGWLVLADRWSRQTFVRAQFLLGAVGYGACALALGFELAAPSTIYAALYMLSAQQAASLTGALWVLAADMIRAERRGTVMPRLALGDSIGQVCGYALGSGIALWLGVTAQVDAWQVTGTALFCVIGAGLVGRLPQDEVETLAPADADIDRGVRAAARWLRSQPSFRLLALAVGGNWAAMSALIYYRVDAMESATGALSEFRVLYAGFGVVLLLLVPLGQVLSTRLLPRIPVRQAFLALPLATLVSALVCLFAPGLLAALLTSLLFYVVFAAWDDPARYILLAEAPVDFRGRVTALIDTHAYALGSLVGALVLGAVTIAAPTDALRHLGVLAAAAGFSIVAAWAAWRLRRT